MSHNATRADVLRARLDCDRAEHRLAAHWQPWHARLTRHRLGLLIGGGLLGGVALATVSPKRWSSLGALLFGGGASVLRSPLGLPLLGALWTTLLDTSSRAPDRAEVNPEAPSFKP